METRWKRVGTEHRVPAGKACRRKARSLVVRTLICVPQTRSTGRLFSYLVDLIPARSVLSPSGVLRTLRVAVAQCEVKIRGTRFARPEDRHFRGGVGLDEGNSYGATGNAERTVRFSQVAPWQPCVRCSPAVASERRRVRPGSEGRAPARPCAIPQRRGVHSLAGLSRLPLRTVS